jgi:hypothetical protein
LLIVLAIVADLAANKKLATRVFITQRKKELCECLLKDFFDNPED